MEAVLIKTNDPSKIKAFIDFVNKAGMEASAIDQDEYEDIAFGLMTEEDEDEEDSSEEVFEEVTEDSGE